MNRVMMVKCISVREAFPEQIKVNEIYYINADSIFIDTDGDAIGMVYRDDCFANEVGSLKLSHFYTINKNY